MTTSNNRLEGAGKASELVDSLSLVRRAQEGDRDAYNRLFNKYYLRVRRIARARLGPGLRRRADSSDILHEAMVNAIESFERWEIGSDSKLIALFAKIVENSIRDFAKHTYAAKRDPNKERLLDQLSKSLSSGPLAAEMIDGLPPPDDEVASRERRELVAESLHDLSETHREVILLRNYQNESWEGIARLMGRPSPAAARMLHARAMVEWAKAAKRALGLIS